MGSWLSKIWQIGPNQIQSVTNWLKICSTLPLISSKSTALWSTKNRRREAFTLRKGPLVSHLIANCSTRRAIPTRHKPNNKKNLADNTTKKSEISIKISLRVLKIKQVCKFMIQKMWQILNNNKKLILKWSEVEIKWVNLNKWSRKGWLGRSALPIAAPKLIRVTKRTSSWKRWRSSFRRISWRVYCLEE